ncbi:MAG TPA: hypothetical protein GX701_04945 [Clostridiales bacterium]|nr:hypothetical protein [Clostridiales bacterium]
MVAGFLLAVEICVVDSVYFPEHCLRRQTKKEKPAEKQTLMEAGQYVGQQLVVPISYSIWMYITTEEAAKGTALWPLLSDKVISTQTEFVHALLAYKTATGQLPAPGNGLSPEQFVTGSGVPLWDLEEGIINVRSEGFQQLLTDAVAVASELLDAGATPAYAPWESLAKEECLLFADYYSSNELKGHILTSGSQSRGKRPLLLPCPPLPGRALLP